MLFVACYALLRLQVPRHPPCALSNLITKMIISYFQILARSACFSATRTVKNTRRNWCSLLSMQFSRCTPEGAPPSDTLATSAFVSVADVNRCKYLHGLKSASRQHSTNECHLSAFRAFWRFRVMLSSLDWEGAVPDWCLLRGKGIS